MGEIMGGKVLEHEGKTIYNEGKEEGREKGVDFTGTFANIDGDATL